VAGGFADGAVAGSVGTSIYGGNFFENVLVGALSGAIISGGVYGTAKGIQYAATAATHGIDSALEALGVSVNKRAETAAANNKPLPFEDPRAGDWFGQDVKLRYTESLPGGGVRVVVDTLLAGGKQGAAEFLSEMFGGTFDPNRGGVWYRGTMRFEYNPLFREVRVDYNQLQREYIHFGN
jgi:hypothetical protein